MSDEKLVPWTAEWLLEYARRAKLVISRPESKRRTSIYDIQGGLCPWCGLGMTRGEATLEHIIPLSKGGNNDIANLALAHAKCNHERSNNMELRPVDRPEFYFIRARLDAYEVEWQAKHPRPPELKVGEFWYGPQKGITDKPCLPESSHNTLPEQQ